MTTHEVLVKARALIERPEDWCGGGWGESKRCAIHALCDTTAIGPERIACHPAWDALTDAIGGRRYIGSWNDSHTHAEVIAAFDKAIAATAPAPDLSFLASSSLGTVGV